jgi:hypothetical protein
VRLLWRPPFTRTHAGWVRWGDDPLLTLPLSDPGTPLPLELWPVAGAVAPAAAAGVRGCLGGPAGADLTVRIAPPGVPSTRFTRTDAAGEFLFLPPGRLPTDATGRVPLRITVTAADGTPRALLGGHFAPTSAGADFAGPLFSIASRGVARILFALA